MAKITKKQTKKITKRTITLKMEFDLVDWLDSSYVPAFDELASTLKIISLFNQNPSTFDADQTKIITQWLTKNSVEKFSQAYNDAIRHQALLKEEGSRAWDSMWTRRTNVDH